ncbi:hypothetical protein B0J13DRAFT_521154 [Dactylonectria estremocensis]|uniref:Uncharacterized protein n=1 Tax=Dactylonectria estremocensis TaxID=1079267 RepID=A0A9P9F7G4_9HYPO|nr:hypothetical protein B0J13DRAFT_521154 [Dactylonectria estremocensis]
MTAKPTRGWDANSHGDLLLVFIDEVNPSKAVITSVTERLAKKGYTYSFDAVNQHVQKLRRTRDTAGFEAAVGGSGSATSTPRKTATPRKRATPAKKSKAMIAAEEDEDEDDKTKLKKEINSDDEQPTTPKRPAKRAKKNPKPEPVSDVEIEDAEIEGEI